MSSREPLSNIGVVCEHLSSKPGGFSGKPEEYIGKYVKLGFPTSDPQCKLEHMWVKVESLHVEGPEQLQGTLNNDPIYAELIIGDTIVFDVSEIEMVME